MERSAGACLISDEAQMDEVRFFLLVSGCIMEDCFAEVSFIEDGAHMDAES